MLLGSESFGYELVPGRSPTAFKARPESSPGPSSWPSEFPGKASPYSDPISPREAEHNAVRSSASFRWRTRALGVPI